MVAKDQIRVFISPQVSTSTVVCWNRVIELEVVQQAAFEVGKRASPELRQLLGLCYVHIPDLPGLSFTLSLFLSLNNATLHAQYRFCPIDPKRTHLLEGLRPTPELRAILSRHDQQWGCRVYI